MQERRADNALHRPLVVKMECVGGDDRLVGQDGGFELTAIVRNRLRRQHSGVGQVRLAEHGSNGVYIGILTIEESVGADRHFVSETEQIETPVQRCGVAGNGEMWNGVEVFGNRVIPEIVSQRIGDAEQVAHGILIKAANLEIPIVVDLVLDLDETRIGGGIRARAGLAVTYPGRINGGRQHRKFWRAEINDAAWQTSDVGFVVAEVRFDDRPIADIEIEGTARQRAIGRTLRHIALTLAVNDVEPIANLSVRGASADVDVLGENRSRIEALRVACVRCVRRSLQNVVEHTRRSGGGIERAGKSVQHLDAGEILGWNCGSADNIETVEPCRLYDAALETSRLRTGDFKALLVPDLDRRKVSKCVGDRLYLQVIDQILGDRCYRERRVEQVPVSERAQADCGGIILRVRRGIVNAARAGLCRFAGRWWWN